MYIFQSGVGARIRRQKLVLKGWQHIDEKTMEKVRFFNADVACTEEYRIIKGSISK